MKQRINGRLAVLTALWLLIVGVCSVAAQTQRAGEVGRMVDALRAMGRYSVTYTITADDANVALMDGAMQGSIVVADDRYRITLPDAEVFGEGDLRYEINHPRKEITLMTTEHESSNLLSNPARAFELIASYRATLVAERADASEWSLTPPDDQLTTIRLVIDAKSHLPKRIRYEMDGAGVEIRINAIRPISTALKAFDQSAYGGYEFIDFR